MTRMILGDLAPARLTRRRLLGGAATLAALPALPTSAWAEEVVDLDWEDLLPSGDGALTRTLREIGVVEHADLASGFEQPEAVGVTTRYDGQVVRLSGFVVPLDYDGTGVTVFILVPYVGACVHVPPPPANQLVLVTAERPYEAEDTWQPVTVTGMFGTAAASTAVATIGYALSAERIEPYRN